MGSWGVGITQDDTVLDITFQFKDCLKDSQNILDVTNKLIKDNNELLEDDSDSYLFWIALAKCQWEYGELQSDVFNNVKENFINEKGMEIWKDESDKLFEKRKKAIFDFIKKIENQNPKPKKYPQRKKPLFLTGDCLSLKVNDDYYSLAIVTDSYISYIEDGYNYTVIALNYWDRTPPQINDVENSNVLRLTFGEEKEVVHVARYFHMSFKESKNRISKIGNIDVKRFSGILPNNYNTWGQLLELIEKQMEFLKQDKIQIL